MLGIFLINQRKRIRPAYSFVQKECICCMKTGLTTNVKESNERRRSLSTATKEQQQSVRGKDQNTKSAIWPLRAHRRHKGKEAFRAVHHDVAEVFWSNILGPAEASRQGEVKRLFLRDHILKGDKKHFYREVEGQGQNSTVSRRYSEAKTRQDNSLPLL